MSLWFELKYTLRLLIKNSWHSLLSAVIVALCIAITWTAVSSYYHTQIKPLPFTDAEQWYAIEEFDRVIDADPTHRLDAYTHQLFSSNIDDFEVLGGYAYQPAALTVEGLSERVHRVAVSPELLQATGIFPAIGSGFSSDDRLAGANSVAVISYDLWVNTFAADEQILDRQIVIDGQAHSIVGVLGQNDHLVAAFDVYTPLSLSAVTQPSDTNLQVGTIGKLNPNTSLADVNVAIASLVSSLRSQYPEYYSENYEAWLTPLNEVFRFNVSPGVNAILGFVVITMTALGCISIGNLFTARMLERGQEFALRNALGSSKYRLLRQSLLESFAVCLIGSIVGVGLSYLASFGLAQMGEQIYNSGALGSVPVDLISGTALIEFVFLLFLIVAIWLLSGLIPALKVARKDPSEVLSGSSSGALSSGSARSTTILVSLQIICTCFALIVCAGGIYAVALTRTIDYGFETEDIITASLDFPTANSTHNDKLLYMNELQAEVEALPTVETLAFSSQLPGSMAGGLDYRTEEMPDSNDQFQQIPVVAISPNYLSTLDIELTTGRSFDSNDNDTSLPVALIDTELAQSLWPDETALGKRIQIDPRNTATWVTVVGITSGITPAMSANRPQPIVYLPLAQSSISQLHLLARTNGTPTIVSTQLKQAATNVDRGIPLYRTFTMAEHLDSLEANLLLLRNIFATISLASLIMAITGIYGVVSRSILQRVREIGVRRAMGSSNWKVIRLFLRKTATYLGIGSVVGGGPAILALVALIDGDEGVLTVVPPIYIAVCFGLAMFIALATYLPTRRAISLEPGDALRYE